MAPTLRAGDLVLIDHRGAGVDVGDVAAVLHPHRPDLVIVKRVERLDDENRLVLRSDNDAAGDASDSRSFGAVSADRLVGRVSSRLVRR